MLSYAIWLAGLVLETVLIVRAVQGRFLGRYPFFYSYLASVLLRSLALVPVFRWWPDIYPQAYWYSQFLLVLLGCGVVWEIYRTALSGFPGAARMAQNVLPFLFVLSFSRVFVKACNNLNLFSNYKYVRSPCFLIERGHLNVSLLVGHFW